MYIDFNRLTVSLLSNLEKKCHYLNHLRNHYAIQDPYSHLKLPDVYLLIMEQQIMDDVNDSHDNNKHVTIQALRRKTRNIISTLLNPRKIIPNEKGLPRDWQGLADLCGISGEKFPSIQQDSDPCNKVLELWSEKDKNESTIDNLIKFLEELDRFDVIDDTQALIEEDINFFIQHPNGYKNNNLDLDADKYILTIDDVSRISQGLEPQTYDAFVLFADDDIDFTTELIQTMEKDYNLKLCVKDRDLVGGGFEHDSVIKLISERCGRLIVIVSPAFLDSSANKFFYSFAQAIGIEQRNRKIIPCLYKPCESLPPELSCYFMLDYRRSGQLWNFWEKLYTSIRTPKITANSKSTNLINRSHSQYNSSSRQCLIKSVLHNEKTTSGTLKPISQVKFSSLVDLNSIDNEKMDENMTSSTSANSLGTYPIAIKKNKSIYKRIRQIIKPKSTKSDEVKLALPKVPAVEVEKEKKKKFFSRGSKRKKAAVVS